MTGALQSAGLLSSKDQSFIIVTILSNSLDSYTLQICVCSTKIVLLLKRYKTDRTCSNNGCKIIQQVSFSKVSTNFCCLQPQYHQALPCLFFWYILKSEVNSIKYSTPMVPRKTLLKLGLVTTVACKICNKCLWQTRLPLVTMPGNALIPPDNR